MKTIFKKINKKLLLIPFFITTLIFAAVHTLDIAANHTFSITNYIGASYHIRTNVNKGVLQWIKGDTVVLTQGTDSSAWFYQNNGTFAQVPIPRVNGAYSGGGGGGTGGGGTSGGSYTITGVPIWINGVCVANCDGTPTVIIYQSPK